MDLSKLFSLEIGEEQKEKVIQNVVSNISFYGANFWILVCAIFIASIGLNVNSTAVIIGAMLISPLMGPIVGAGFALGMYDFALLKKSLINLLIATIIGLLVSFLYFLLTPYKEAQSELLSRTSPNIYDVLIAVFGGLVGVISVTRIEKGNTVPGVAIATALMPPLCTAGYGLATGNYSYFGGAFFLYLINCVFICISTFFVAKLLQYPSVKFVDKKEKNLVRNSIYAITTLLILPSLFFAFQFIKMQKFQNNVENFIKAEFEDKGNTIIYKKTNFTQNPKSIILAFLTRKFTAEEIALENQKLKDYGIENTELIIRQDQKFLQNVTEDQTNEVDASSAKIATELNSKIDKSEDDTASNEITQIFPEITSVSIGEKFKQNDSLKVKILTYEAEKDLEKTKLETLKNFVKLKLETDSVEIFRLKK